MSADPRAEAGTGRAELGRTLAGFLGLGDQELVAFVGAGGKTTLMLALGAALAERGRRVLMTTTTRVGADQVAGVPGFWFEEERDGKLIGPSPEAVDEAWRAGSHDVVLVEADGARGLLAKAPGPHEPVIPSRATLVVAVLAADALDRPIAEVAHRPELVAAVARCSMDDQLTIERAVHLVTSPAGLRKGVPAGAGFAAAITRVGPNEKANARRLATRLGEFGITAALLERIV